MEEVCHSLCKLKLGSPLLSRDANAIFLSQPYISAYLPHRSSAIKAPAETNPAPS